MSEEVRGGIAWQPDAVSAGQSGPKKPARVWVGRAVCDEDAVEGIRSLGRSATPRLIDAVKNLAENEFIYRDEFDCVRKVQLDREQIARLAAAERDSDATTRPSNVVRLDP